MGCRDAKDLRVLGMENHTWSLASGLCPLSHAGSAGEGQLIMRLLPTAVHGAHSPGFRCDQGPNRQGVGVSGVLMDRAWACPRDLMDRAWTCPRGSDGQGMGMSGVLTDRAWACPRDLMDRVWVRPGTYPA